MKPCIVVYDDGGGLCVPMGWAADCDGAIEANSEAVVMFNSPADARKAIRISKAFAKLCKAQGRPANTDFDESIRYVRIVPLIPKKGGAV